MLTAALEALNDAGFGLWLGMFLRSHESQKIEIALAWKGCWTSVKRTPETGIVWCPGVAFLQKKRFSRALQGHASKLLPHVIPRLSMFSACEQHSLSPFPH